MRAYHKLPQEQGRERPVAAGPKRELTEAEEELLSLLKSRGVPSICDSISKEINYVWAVLSGFKTLAAVGNFYFACGSQTFGYNPAYDFFAAHGMQLALFALQKFIHNENVLVPVLECIHIFTKLHVDGALEFLAIADAREIVLKCVRFHDNKHDVISSACQALGSLVMNDLVKETVSSSELVLELLGLLKRFHTSQEICRGALVPLGFLVTDAAMTATFVDGNGVALTMSAMKRFIKDAELVWHAIGLLNGLNAKTLDVRLIFAIFGFSGIPRIVEALASHLDTEEIAVEGFQLLAKLAAHPEAYKAINKAKVLDLAYVALFAYSGPQHRHTRIEIKKTMYPFQKCTLYDPRELSHREQASRTDLLLYAFFVLCFALSSALSLYDRHSSDLVLGLQRALMDKRWPGSSHTSRSSSSYSASLGRSLSDVNSVEDVWSYLLNPLHETLFQDRWYNGELYAADLVDVQLGVVDRTNLLLGGLQLRLIRVKNATCERQACFPPYSRDVELKSAVETADFVDRWTDPNPSSSSSSSGASDFRGKLAAYSSSGGYRQFIPRLNTTFATGSNACGPYCQLTMLKNAKWIDRSSRALFAEFNLYNAAVDAHCAVRILFELAATGGVIVTTDITPLHLDQYPGGVFILMPRFYVEIALLAGFLWFTHKQIVKLLRYRWFYFIVVSHVVDFTIVALWVAVIVVRLQALVRASHALQLKLAANNSFVDLTENTRLLRSERVLMAWAGFFMWWRLFRFAKCIRPLERVMEKFERAESLLGGYLALLLVYVAGFAQVGTLLFPSSSITSFRSFSVSITTMSKGLLKRWHGEEAMGGAYIAFRVLFQLLATFAIINIAATILRERFESSREVANEQDANDESLLEIAKKQLESNGISVIETSLPKKLRLAATRGLEKIHQATKDIFTIAEEPAELTNLQRVWGLKDRLAEEQPPDERVRGVERNQSSLLHSAEELDRLLDQQLCYFALRVEDAMQKLQVFQQLLSQQIDEKEALEEEKEERRRIDAAAFSAAEAAAQSDEELGNDLHARSEKEQLHVEAHEPQVVIVSTEASHQYQQSPPTGITVPVTSVLPGSVASANDQEEDVNEELKAN